MHLETDAVTEPVEEAVLQDRARGFRAAGGIAGCLEVVADGVVHRDAGDAGPDHRRREVERLLREAVELPQILRRLPYDERARHVGEARRLTVARPEIDDDRLSPRDRTRAHVVPDRRLRAAGDDELVGSRAVAKKCSFDVLLDELDRQRLVRQR